MSLMQAGLLELKTITRHQLLVDRRIPFTSHNSSACLYGEADGRMDQLMEHCKSFLVRESAHDSDAGLCIAFEKSVGEGVVEFGKRAKHSILTKEEAHQIAKDHGIYLEGFLNTKIGVIGSLAATGLRYEACDGRLLWMKNLRETSGIFKIGAFREITGVECVVTRRGDSVEDEQVLHVTDWCRPVMHKGKITLFVDRVENKLEYEYESASKEFIKSISE